MYILIIIMYIIIIIMYILICMRAHSMHDMMSDVDDPLIQEISLTDRSNKKKTRHMGFCPEARENK